MNRERIADVSTGGAWTFLGLSMTQINEILQALALILTIVATGITIYIHVRNRFWK
jgi:disulfide bond formation protein DsbB